jgi:hypothetical protein
MNALRDRNCSLPIDMNALRDHNCSLPISMKTLRDHNCSLPISMKTLRDRNCSLPVSMSALRSGALALPRVYFFCEVQDNLKEEMQKRSLTGTAFGRTPSPNFGEGRPLTERSG